MTTKTTVSLHERHDLTDSETRRETDAKRVETKIEQLDYPWRDREVLHYLYWELDLSQYEIAAHLGCDQATVSKQMHHHDIETRESSGPEPGLHPTFTQTPGGYQIAQCQVNQECEAVRIHQLLACVKADPHDVFAPETHVHHRVGSKSIGFQIDTPESVEVLPASVHLRLDHTITEDEIDDLLVDVFEGFDTPDANRTDSCDGDLS